jgi:endonuclease-8
MPEGDTVWLHARRLDGALRGERLVRTDFRLPALATADLAGWTVAEVLSRGKHLLLRAVGDDGRRLTLHSHLRMDGSWRVYRPGERFRGGPGHAIRVVLAAPRAVAVGYRLHDVALLPTGDESRLVGHLGPDLLGPDWDAAEAVRRLAARPDRPVGEALLDQRNLAGVGNLYKCELLFLRGVSPWAPVSAVPDLPALVELAHRTLRANRDRWAQSTTGSLRRGEISYVYGRHAEPCRRCGTAVRRDGEGDRVTYWCPVCQPGPGPG